MNARKSVIPPEAVIYAFAHTEAWLEAYAKSHQLPSYELAHRVAGLILSTAGGEVLGAFNNLPALRRPPAKAHKAPRPMALVSGTRGETPGKTVEHSVKRTISAAGRKAMRRAQKLRWQRFHEQKAKAA